MRKSIAMLAVGMLLVIGGCKNNNDDMGTSNTSSSEPKKMMADACTHCQGVQTATADGKCPICGAKVTK